MKTFYEKAIASCHVFSISSWVCFEKNCFRFVFPLSKNPLTPNFSQFGELFENSIFLPQGGQKIAQKLYIPWIRIKQHLHASAMRAIDSSTRTTLLWSKISLKIDNQIVSYPSYTLPKYRNKIYCLSCKYMKQSNIFCCHIVLFFMML